jgi:hypothetical protein
MFDEIGEKRRLIPGMGMNGTIDRPELGHYPQQSSAIELAHNLDTAGDMNVTHYCAVEVLADESRRLDLGRLEAAILREYVKEGKVV